MSDFFLDASAISTQFPLTSSILPQLTLAPQFTTQAPPKMQMQQRMRVAPSPTEQQQQRQMTQVPPKMQMQRRQMTTQAAPTQTDHQRQVTQVPHAHERPGDLPLQPTSYEASSSPSVSPYPLSKSSSSSMTSLTSIHPSTSFLGMMFDPDMDNDNLFVGGAISNDGYQAPLKASPIFGIAPQVFEATNAYASAASYSSSSYSSSSSIPASASPSGSGEFSDLSDIPMLRVDFAAEPAPLQSPPQTFTLLPSVLQTFEGDIPTNYHASSRRNDEDNPATKNLLGVGGGNRSDVESPRRSSTTKRPGSLPNLDGKSNEAPKNPAKKSPVSPSTKLALRQMIEAKSRQSPSNVATPERKFFPDNFEIGQKRRQSSIVRTEPVPIKIHRRHATSTMPSPLPNLESSDGRSSTASSPCPYRSDASTHGSADSPLAEDGSADLSDGPYSPASATDSKEEERKRKNRQAALRCRMKKRDREEKLSKTASNFEKKNESLRRHNDQLKQQLKSLTTMLWDHDLICGCHAARMRRSSGEVLRQEGIEGMKRDLMESIIS